MKRQTQDQYPLPVHQQLLQPNQHQADADQLCDQLKSIMTDFQSVSVSDLKLIFNQQQQRQKTPATHTEDLFNPRNRKVKVPIAKKDSDSAFGTKCFFSNKGSLVSQVEKIPIKSKKEESITSQQQPKVQDQTETLIRENEMLKRQLVDAQRLAGAHNENKQQHEQEKEKVEKQVNEWKGCTVCLEKLCESQKRQIEEFESQKEQPAGCEQMMRLPESQEQNQTLQSGMEDEGTQKRTLRGQLENQDQLDVTKRGSSEDDGGVSPILIDIQSSQEQLVVESQRDLNTLFQQMEASSVEASRTQAKLVEQIKRSNEIKQTLDERQKQVAQLTQENSSLRDKLEYQIRATKQAQVQVTELEDITNTQQIQIDSLAMVNCELKKECVSLPRTNDGENSVAGGSLGYVSSDNSLESLALLDEPREKKTDIAVGSKTPPQIEELQYNWGEQRTNIQQDQNRLFQKLGKFNLQSVSKIDELCESIEKLSPQPAGRGAKESFNKHTAGLHLPQLGVSSDTLDVIHEIETTEIDGLVLVSDGGDYDITYDDSKLEEFESAWMQQTSQIESIQREQEELLSRMRASSSDASTRLLNLSFSIEEEDAQVDNSKTTLKKDIQARNRDNKCLLQKLREAEAMAASHIQNLEEELEAKESKIGMLQNTCHNLKSSKQALLSEKDSLMGRIGGLKDVLLETENICKNQKLSLARLEQDKESLAREMEVRKSSLENAEAISKHQRESLDCLRNETQTLEQALDDHRLRTTEVEAVCKFQKAMITGLQAEKAVLTKRLLDIEEEFRKHLSGNLSILAQMAELRCNIGHAIGPDDEEKAYIKNRNTIESEEEDTSMESSFCDDDGDIFSARVLDSEEKSYSTVASCFSKNGPVAVVDDKPAAEEILRLLSFEG